MDVKKDTSSTIKRAQRFQVIYNRRRNPGRRHRRSAGASLSVVSGGGIQRAESDS